MPGRPTITAGDRRRPVGHADLVAPSASNGSSAITGYVVTPYLNGVAQTPIILLLHRHDADGHRADGGGVVHVHGGGGERGRAGAAVHAVRDRDAERQSAAHLRAAAERAGERRLQRAADDDGRHRADHLVDQRRVAASGVTLNPSTGLLSGTPTTAGSYSFTVRIVDASGQSDTRAAAVTIAAPPVLTVPPPPAARVAVAYSLPLSVSGGTAPYTYSLASGTLPPGLTLNTTTGLISGTPTTQGAYAFTARVDRRERAERHQVGERSPSGPGRSSSPRRPTGRRRRRDPPSRTRSPWRTPALRPSPGSP